MHNISKTIELQLSKLNVIEKRYIITVSNVTSRRIGKRDKAMSMENETHGVIVYKKTDGVISS